MLKKIGARYDRIENSIGSGFPDLDFTYLGKNYKYEMKIAKKGKISIRPAQSNWHKLESNVGGNSWFLVLDEEKIWKINSADVQPDIREIENKILVKDYKDLI